MGKMLSLPLGHRTIEPAAAPKAKNIITPFIIYPVFLKSDPQKQYPIPKVTLNIMDKNIIPRAASVRLMEAMSSKTVVGAIVYMKSLWESVHQLSSSQRWYGSSRP